MMSESDAGRKFRDAAQNNELEKVKVILKSFPNNKAVLDSKDSYVSSTKNLFWLFSRLSWPVRLCVMLQGWNALIYASDNGHLEVVKFLHESGADIHAVDINVCGDSRL